MSIETPTREEIRKFQNTLLTMDKKTFDMYKQIANILASNMPSAAKSDSDAIDKQRQFIRQTAGKIQVDEDAINELRMRSMI